MSPLSKSLLRPFKNARSRRRRAIARSSELKFWDTFMSGNVPAAGIIDAVSELVLPGTGPTTRIGRHVHAVALYFDLIISFNHATYDAGKFDFVVDSQPNGATPGYAGVYDVTVMNAPCAQLNWAIASARFRLLRSIPFADNGSVAGGSQHFRGILPLNFDVEYYDDAGHLARNAVLITLASQGATGAAGGSAYIMGVRFAFTDD